MLLTSLVGNEGLKRRLWSGEGIRGLSHAYVIVGAPGTGRHTLSRLLAASAVCTAGEKERPCGVCVACKKTAAGLHPDVITLSGGEGKPIAVDQVRQMRADAYIRPNEGRRKVYLLEEADRMNPSAQNALLKLLEDGPQYTIFLLLTIQPGSLLETVRSRCQELTLTALEEQTCRSALSDRFPQLDSQEIDKACRDCQGVLGRGISLLQGQTGQEQHLRQQACELARVMGEGDELALFQAAMPLDSMKREALVPLLDRLLVQLGEDLPASSNPRRILRGAALVKKLREAAQRSANPGQLAGWLCAGMFLEM